MFAVEFETKINDGLIWYKIPQNIKDIGNIGSAKFIMMFEKEEKKKIINKEKMRAISIDTRGYKFNREEAHKR